MELLFKVMNQNIACFNLEGCNYTVQCDDAELRNAVVYSIIDCA